MKSKKILRISASILVLISTLILLTVNALAEGGELPDAEPDATVTYISVYTDEEIDFENGESGGYVFCGYEFSEIKRGDRTDKIVYYLKCKEPETLDLYTRIQESCADNDGIFIGYIGDDMDVDADGRLFYTGRIDLYANEALTIEESDDGKFYYGEIAFDEVTFYEYSLSYDLVIDKELADHAIELLKEDGKVSSVGYMYVPAAANGDDDKIMLGDVNGDSKINAADYAMVKRHVLKTYTLVDDQLLAADVNENGKVDVADYAMIRRHVLGTYTIGGNIQEEAGTGG